MAVFAVSGTLTASTAAPTTFTSWQPYIIVSIQNTATAGPVSLTADGTVPTVNGADCPTVNLAANALVTVALRNRLPKPDLQTTTPLSTDPSATEAFTTNQSKVSLITALTGVTYSAVLSSNPGTSPVLG